MELRFWPVKKLVVYFEYADCRTNKGVTCFTSAVLQETVSADAVVHVPGRSQVLLLCVGETYHWPHVGGQMQHINHLLTDDTSGQGGGVMGPVAIGVSRLCF